MKGACSRAWVRGAWAAALLGTGLLPACASQKDTMQSEIQYDLGVNDLQAGQAPRISARQARWVTLCIRLELLILLVMPLLAVFMARGYGASGG